MMMSFESIRLMFKILLLWCLDLLYSVQYVYVPVVHALRSLLIRYVRIPTTPTKCAILCRGDLELSSATSGRCHLEVRNNTRLLAVVWTTTTRRNLEVGFLGFTSGIGRSNAG